MIRYLVSYIANNNGRLSYGSVEITRSEPICSTQDVAEITRELHDHTGLHSIIVLGFSQFAEPGEELTR
ncbi:hypothetical protein [Actinoplanes sp. NPDC026619]|uniref:hypothetical protein n=1 Tax=Actinoplanes sp. NPDC026619 TaxID=3155798 RepID=UPI0033C4EB8E